MALAAKVPHVQPRRLTILGSTGSVGCNTIDLIERSPSRYEIVALTANRNAIALAEQARRLRPSLAVVADADAYGALKDALEGTGIEVAAGPEAVTEAASRPTDWMMAAIVGSAGLESTLAGVHQGAIIGLANKETLVCAGDIFMAEIESCGASLVPVDSEHSAIYQVLDQHQADRVERIILTASGGPFRAFSRDQMASVTPEQAVAHPNWDMGAKISVDSATMMNKGLEVIEAQHLFPVSAEQIEIVVHPQSVIHSMVEYVDGSVLAQLGTPDMRTPIAYALGWPERIEAPSARLDFQTLGALTFETPDSERFPALRLAREALDAGGSAPAYLNAANEVAVGGFLGRKIPFLAISEIVESCLEEAPSAALESIEDVRDADTEARRVATARISDFTSG
ncbi:MAG: 1-deoxy-D-xylulose-5-phosphate reductoisomerase [Alphaproteobacteria bacterium]|nr:1-deoxy-D-xylulose-5-phosphate reductoisomerase [Alphaproteobacteria bacterium]